MVYRCHSYVNGVLNKQPEAGRIENYDTEPQSDMEWNEISRE